jgi:hypothetical protein
LFHSGNYSGTAGCSWMMLLQHQRMRRVGVRPSGVLSADVLPPQWWCTHQVAHALLAGGSGKGTHYRWWCEKSMCYLPQD